MLARNPFPRWSGRADRIALAAALALFVALALFGQRYHWVEEAGTAERDGYVAQAERVLAGELPRDPFRPPLYALLTAGLGGLLGDPFAAARLISNAAAAALAWLAYRMGRRLAGPAAGGWAMAAVAVNPNLWILGQHATTDMLFGALAAGLLLAGLAYLEAPGPRPALAAGLLLGLCAFTRGNALFLVPGLAAAWWAAPGRRPARLPHLAWAGAAAGAVLLPHWALRLAAFGDPFHDENWKNLAWKLHGFPDWSYLDRVPFSGPLELLRQDGAAILSAGFAELARFAAEGLPQLLGTWAHALLFLAGAAFALGRRRRPVAAAAPAAWLLLAGFLYLLGVAFTFFAWGRLLLPLLPAAYAVAFLPWGEPGILSAPRGRTATTALALGLVLLLAVKTFGFRLPAFVARHPYQEVATLRRLERGLPPGARLAGTSPFLGRYLEHGYVALPDAFGAEVWEPGLYLRELERLLLRERVAYLVVGAKDLRDRPAALLGPSPPAPWLVPAGRGREVAVWRVAAR